MYIVIDKKTRKVVHVNPAPLEQKLDGKEVYFRFDEKSMEIVRAPSPARYEIRGDQLVELTQQEPVSPAERIDAAAPKGTAALVREGTIPLEPGYKVSGNQIVEKSVAEKVAEGLLKLAPEDKVEGDRIVRKSERELLEEGLTTLADIKKERIEQFSAMALRLRADILPDYKLQNAALGFYDEAKVDDFKATIEAFRKEFQRLEELVTDAKDLKAIDAIREEFPRSLVAPSSTGGRPNTAGKKKR